MAFQFSEFCVLEISPKIEIMLLLTLCFLGKCRIITLFKTKIHRIERENGLKRQETTITRGKMKTFSKLFQKREIINLISLSSQKI